MRSLWWILVLLSLAPRGAQAATLLSVGEAFEGGLAPGESGVFGISADTGQYLRLRLEQQGIDLGLRLYAPDGALLREVDGPGGLWVEEILSLVTGEAGTFRLEVAARPGDAGAGRYRLVLEELRATTPADALRLRADELYHRGRHLRQRPGREDRLEALEDFRAAAEASRRASDAKGEADALDQMGGVYLLLGETATARDFFLRALPLYQAAGHRAGQADVENDLGIALARLGERDEARERYLRALELWRELGDERGQAVVLNSLGALHYRLGDLPQARENFQDALVLRRAAGDRPGEVVTLNSLAVVHRQLGEIGKSLEGYRQALAIVRETGDRSREALILFNIATAQRVLGELQPALDGQRRVLEIARELGKRDLEQKALVELAEIDRDLGLPEDALELLGTALELAREFESLSEEAWVLMTTGWVYIDLARTREAREHFLGALDISRAREDRRTELHSLRGLAKSYRHEGRLVEALAALDEALAVSRELGDPVLESDSLREAGEIELAAGRPQRALDLLHQAAAGNRELADPIREAMIRSGLARAERSLGRLPEARAEIERALAKSDEVRAAVIAPELRASFRAGRFRDHELHIELLMELDARNPDAGLRAAALASSERSRARGLVELLTEAGIDVRSGLDPGLVAREEETARRLSGLQSRLIFELSRATRNEDRLAVLRRKLDDARVERERLEEEIRRRHPRYATVRYPQPLGLDEIRPLLDDGTALLEYALGEERSFLFVVTREGFDVYTLAPADDIAGSVDRFRRAAAERPSRRLQGRLNQMASRLYEQLIAPAEASLAGVGHLLIAPDRELYHLPFEALRTADGYLLAQRAVSYVPSASVLASLERPARPAAAGGFVGFAQPLEAAPSPPPTASMDILTRGAVGSEPWRWRPLPGSGEEVRAIARLFPGQARTYIGADAGEGKVKRDPAVARARVLHFAVHGLVDDREPAYSGLLLGTVADSDEDGLLQVHEIFNLRLHADLVVLSACDTGLGKRLRGEGILGLSRAFFYAGAGSLVVSLWPAADASTSELMQAFYQRLQQGEGKAEALAAAKRDLLADGRYAHPFYWAPFILVGRPR